MENQAIATAPPDPLAERRPARLLIVDDKPANLLALQALLEQPGHEVVQAASGQEAIASALVDDFALILLDVMMPEMDGFETAQRIRETERNRRTPIIFVTAYRELEEQLLRGYVAGAVDFLYKPIDPDILRFKVSVFVDLYQQRELIRKYSSQMEMANIDLERRVAERTTELRASNHELRLFAYAACHDLREPLRTIATFAQLLDDRYKKQFDGDAGDLVSSIANSARRLDSLLTDLLAYSEQINRPERPGGFCDSEAVLATVLMLLEVSIKDTRATITHDPLPRVAAEFNEVLQLLQNLIDNALKYKGTAPPLIHISARQEDEKWVFFIKDNGLGIESCYHDEVFGIFKRLHGREYGGNGIGLAICKKIVERRHGRIWVESQPGQGSTFCFTLPPAD
jgi:two-component system sensor histidine kinase/response regulator